MAGFNPFLSGAFAPPVMEARRWIDGVTFPPERPLINVSQAAPVDPPPPALRAAMAEAVLADPDAHLYGPVLGNDALRERLSENINAHYGAATSADQIAITAGCNQAFVAATATLAGPGDAVILPTPYYFNHKMWLDMAGIETTILPCDETLLPDPEAAAACITDRTRAIVLISPNNPCGVEYPPSLIAAFRDLCRARGIALILDETYRDFHSQSGAPHDLFSDPDWDDTLIHLYSFSKSFRLTGHRVGAVATSVERLSEMEKFLDTVSICPPQVGQIGALWGLNNLDQWLASERHEILARRAAAETVFGALPGWDLLGCGAYFAYIRHPFAEPSNEVAKDLVHQAGILTLPGTMFGPLKSEGGTGLAEATLRIAFANADATELTELGNRIAALPH